MSRVLIIYASHFGQTQQVAQHIRDRLRDRGHEVELANASSSAQGVPPPEDYDAVVLGSRVELGKHAPPLLAYIREHRRTLSKIPSAFFSVSMSAAGLPSTSDPNYYLAKTFASLAWSPTESAVFGGALLYRRYNWILRLVMKQISKRAGHTTDTSKNHYLTDFAEVRDFADRFAWHLDERQSAVHL